MIYETCPHGCFRYSKQRRFDMKGVERFTILSKVLEKRLTQKEAAELLELSTRQVRNLLNQLSQFGLPGLESRSGKIGNNKINIFFRERALSILRDEEYEGFGPTLASEYLESEHGLIIRSETLRRWMLEEGVWELKRKKHKKLHPLRPRKFCFGTLIQIDGSHHTWFEGRGPKCVLMVMIDDATSRITALHFCKSEGLEAYYAVFEKHVLTYGIPLALYGDHCGTLRKPKSDPVQYSSCAHIVSHGLTQKHFSQFRSAMSELGCKVICANSPQAKGRVERCNGILQDRFIKFLRINKISTIKDANIIAKDFIESFNKKFEKAPGSPEDVHQPLGDIKLSMVLCQKYRRVVTKDSVVQFMKNFYFISSSKVKMPYKGKIEIRLLRDNTMRAFYDGESIEMTLLSEVTMPQKTIPLNTKQKHVYHPSATHPWRGNKKKQKEDVTSFCEKPLRPPLANRSV